MNKKSRSLLFKLLIVFFLVSVLSCINFAADWTQWRGPDSNGISKVTNWNPMALAGGAKVLWKTNVGNGHSAVAIKGNYLYTMGNIAITSGGQTIHEDIVYCLDRKTGNTVWRYSYPCKEGPYPGPHATPVISNGNVYTLSKEGDLFCFDAKKGIVIWKRNLIEEFNAERQTWGFSSSPHIEDGILLINACTNGIALNSKTGAKIWASKPGIAGYAVPKIYKINGKKCIVIFGQKAIYGVDFKTGKELWSYPWVTAYDVNAADPIVVDNKVFISSGYNKGCVLIDITNNKPKPVWQNKNMRNHFSSSLYINGHIYGSDGNTGGRRNPINCIEFKTGEVVWTQKIGFASIMAAGGKLIILSERGELIIAKAINQGYKEISRAHLPKTPGSGSYWTAPVLLDGRIYCRNNSGDLFCINMSK
jgi:outer membrane protein assembly factor BamB